MSDLTKTLSELAGLDTPTVCNALESVAPDRRGHGYTVDELVCAAPDLPAVVGFAITARIQARSASSLAPKEQQQITVGYYEYIAAAAKPSVVVIQDLDGPLRGYGAWWGEVNSNVHLGLGCKGVITDGSIRDLEDVAEGFQLLAGKVGPSHAYVHVVDFDVPVSVAGMDVRPGDLIHADRHGAVVVPHDVAAQVKEAADRIAQRERVVIEASQQEGFGMDDLRAAWKKSAEIH